jgi:hypothetical protein
MEYYQKAGKDMTFEEKKNNIQRIQKLEDFNCEKFLPMFKEDSIDKRVERIEKILGFIGALEKWEE